MKKAEKRAHAGRPPEFKGLRLRGVSLEEAQWEKLEAARAPRGISVSHLLREIVDGFFGKTKKQK